MRNVTLAAHSVHSPPHPNPELPGFGRFEICRKRASSQPAGEGLGLGVAVGGRSLRHNSDPPPLPNPPPTQVGLARLVQDKSRPGQARGAWGGSRPSPLPDQNQTATDGSGTTTL